MSVFTYMPFYVSKQKESIQDKEGTGNRRYHMPFDGRHENACYLFNNSDLGLILGIG